MIGTAQVAEPGPRRPPAPVLLVAVFTIGTCGLVYELLAGTLASYVLGDSVTQFSTIIGTYLFAMGVGSWLSGFIDRQLVRRFIEIELAVAILGGVSAAVLFFAFAKLSFFRVVLYGLVFLIGLLVGLEIPLLMRILKDRYDLKELVAHVLTADYLGALLASIAFPLFIVPELGLVRGAFAMGILNAVVALACTYVLADALGHPRQARFLRVQTVGGLVLLGAGLFYSEALSSTAEEELYADPIVFAKSSPYQRIVVTRGRGAVQLFLNGGLQFSSVDEHRYHEALVHPAVSAVAERRGTMPRRALVLGGGDGLAVRELLKVPELEHVRLVDLDPEMTELARSFPLLLAQNEGSLLDPRVELVHADASSWLRERGPSEPPFDLIFADFPDPHSFSVGKLYTERFYRLAARALAEDGALVVQATSPLFARQAYWCVVRTMESAGLSVLPYHASVPSFGEWGYVLASKRPWSRPVELHVKGLRFLNAATLSAMFDFPGDMARVDAEVNRLNNQILVQYYEDEWARWN